MVSRKSELPHRQATSRRVLLEFSLGALAQVDLLTGLPNRTQFRDRLEGAIARAARSGRPLAVALLDLDRFLQVNYDFGESEADRLLVETATRLRQIMRKSDTIARLGGDEFAVVLEDLRDGESAAIAGRRLLEAVAAPCVIAGQPLRITASVGTSLFQVDACDGNGLLRAADLALCRAKQRGGNLCESYSHQLEAGIARAAARLEDTRSRLARLTRREREVLEILVAGKASKVIAYLLGTSERTIESHRANIMGKMCTRSIPELVRRVVEAGVSSETTVSDEVLPTRSAA